MEQNEEKINEDVSVKKETEKKATDKKAPKKRTRQKKIKLLFVCTGNTCRSAMAQYIFVSEAKRLRKASRFTVSGAGISAEAGGDMSEQAKQVLKMRGISFGKHTPKQLDIAAVEKADYVICMTAYHKFAIEAVTGERKNLFTAGDFDGNGDVDDPYGSGVEIYNEVAERLTNLSDAIIFKLCPPEPQKITEYM